MRKCKLLFPWYSNSYTGMIWQISIRCIISRPRLLIAGSDDGDIYNYEYNYDYDFNLDGAAADGGEGYNI